MLTKPVLASLVLAAVLAAATLPALAQAAGQAGTPAGQGAEETGETVQPRGIFGETIDVRVVNVEVVVTDRDGLRVTGLKPEDFRLVVDGEEVPIDYFTEVRGGDAVIPGEIGEGAAIPGLPALAPGERVGTSYLVFIDDYFTVARDRNQVLESLTEHLPMLGPEDRMAVVAFDGKRLRMLSTWSSSQRVLERTFTEAARRPSFGLQRIAERRVHDRTVADSRRSRGGSLLVSQPFALSPEERFYADQVEDQVERAVAAAAATLRGFAAPPGRKIMLMVSGGWPYSPAAFAVDDSTRPIAPTETKQGDTLYAPLTDTANLLGYTVYPIDVPGLGGGSDIDAERGGQLQNSLLVEGEERFGETGPIGSRERERDVQQAFYHVAGATGGRALLNAQRLDAMPQVVADTRSYYWLGYTPERNRDDQRHDIRVTTVRPGLEVRTRDNFRDLSRSAESDMAVESALLFGDAPVAGSLVVTLGEIRPAGRRLVEVPMKILIPADLVTLVPDGDGFAAQVELRLAALDVEDRRSDIPTIPLAFRVESPPPAGSVIPFETQVKLRRERQTLVVSLTDPLSGQSVAARLELAP